MMIPISINDFVEKTLKASPGQFTRKGLYDALKATLEAKKRGVSCCICGSPIWAVGSAVTGSYMCFSCTTGEADDSEDYEFTE